jgi:hypothetical protein
LIPMQNKMLRNHGSRGMIMRAPSKESVTPVSQPALDLIALAQQSPEQARRNLRAMLLAKPNHFGSLPGSSFRTVLQIEEDTTWESIGCVGYDRELEQLRATIYIKQSSGYSDDECATGSEEFVRFYLSYDGGATWQNQGLKAVRVYDERGHKPLEHVVTMQIGPKGSLCLNLNIPRVRAILSWNSPPPAGEPNWLPMWGNVAEASIKFEGSHYSQLSTPPPASRFKLPEQLAESGSQARRGSSIGWESTCVNGGLTGNLVDHPADCCLQTGTS